MTSDKQAIITAFISAHKLPDSFRTTAAQHFIPLAQHLAAKHHGNAKARFTGPVFVGVNGCQGSGKSTLCAFLAHYLANQFKLKVAVLSLDDFYLSHVQRLHLASEQHPLLQTRGVPGTHDIALLQSTLDQLKRQAPVALPRFDKGRDDPVPRHLWPVVDGPVDLLLFEGWCWGVPAQMPQQLLTPCNALEQTRDPDGRWRRFVNEQLATQYQSLFQQMDYWLMLKAPDFSCVYPWRLQQEQRLAALGNPAHVRLMQEPELQFFMQHFQRLSEHALYTMPALVDYLLCLDDKRHIIKARLKTGAPARARIVKPR